MSNEKKLSEHVRDCAYIVPDPHPTDTEAGEREVLGLNYVADEIAALEQRLESVKKHNLRDGKWLDDLGCCRVCGGEIPSGHTPDCDYYKLEKRRAGWQPIETAPKDGTELLLCSIHLYSPRTGCWATYHPNAMGKAGWRTAPICGDKLNPTHWMPLPPQPQENTHD